MLVTDALALHDQIIKRLKRFVYLPGKLVIASTLFGDALVKKEYLDKAFKIRLQSEFKKDLKLLDINTKSPHLSSLFTASIGAVLYRPAEAWLLKDVPRADAVLVDTPLTMAQNETTTTTPIMFAKPTRARVAFIGYQAQQASATMTRNAIQLTAQTILAMCSSCTEHKVRYGSRLLVV